MPLKYKPFPYTYNEGDDIKKIIHQYNISSLNDNIISNLYIEFEELNKDNLPVTDGQEIDIPVLLPYCAKHESGKFELEEEKEKPTPKQVEEKRSFAKSTKNYKTYPYLFCRPGDTIKAVVRLYNDMSLDEKMINWLLDEFNEINKDALPPRLGQQVQIPVLLPFCFRHENDNKIFNDEKDTK